jgi:hypothetical protein
MKRFLFAVTIETRTTIVTNKSHKKRKAKCLSDRVIRSFSKTYFKRIKTNSNVLSQS